MMVFSHTVVGEQGIQEGTKYTPLRDPSFKDQRSRPVVYHLGGRPVRKSRHQMQREVFSTRVLSLVMSFVGTMVLNAELYSILT